MNFIIKFLEPKFVDTFLDGKMYMKANKHFIDLDKESGIKGIGDRYEGSYIEYIDSNKHEIIIEFNGNQYPLKFKRAIFAQHYEELKKIPIMCFTILNSNDFTHISDKDFIISKDTIDDLYKDFKGRKCVLFVDFNEYYRRFTQVLKKKNIGYIKSPITYFGEKHPMTLNEFEENPIWALFYKRNSYAYQRELRILLMEPVESDITIDIGDIRDLTFVIDIEQLSDLIFHKR